MCLIVEQFIIYSPSHRAGLPMMKLSYTCALAGSRLEGWHFHVAFVLKRVG